MFTMSALVKSGSIVPLTVMVSELPAPAFRLAPVNATGVAGRLLAPHDAVPLTVQFTVTPVIIARHGVADVERRRVRRTVVGHVDRVGDGVPAM